MRLGEIEQGISAHYSTEEPKLYINVLDFQNACWVSGIADCGLCVVQDMIINS